MKPNKYTQTDADIDFNTVERTILGVINKDRYKAISRFCRLNTRRFNCGCDYDCCGHTCSINADWQRVNGGIKITITTHFNY